MKHQNKFYLLFSLLTLLFSNIFFFKLLLPFQFKIIADLSSILLINTIFWVAVSIFFWKNKISPKWSNIIFILSLGILSFVFLIFLDKTVGAWLNAPQKAAFAGLVYPPNASIRMLSDEFDVVSKTNNLGLHDKNYAFQKPKNTFRILALGDSFTFGIGVEDGENWESLLEKSLIKKGKKVEVLNAGYNGGFSWNYRRIAQNVIPELKPDLVVIAILQGEELARLIANNRKKKRQGKLIEFGIDFFKAAFYNFYKMATKAQPTKENSVKEYWKGEVNNLLVNVSKAELNRFKMLPDSVQNYFKKGELNPSTLNKFFSFPERLITVNDPENVETKEAIAHFYQNLESIKKVCAHFNSELALTVIPIPAYYNSNQVDYQSIGLEIDSSLIYNNQVDKIIQQAADSLVLPLKILTKKFNEKSQTQQLYFRLDEHLNKNGQLFLSQEIEQFLFENNLLD